MKKIFLSLVAMVFAMSFSYAQWTQIGTTGSYYLNSGNVGIGTTSPSTTLEVNGNQILHGNLSFSNDQTPYLIHGPGNGGAIRIRSNIGAASDRNVQFGAIDNNGTWSSFMIVDQTGNVGIGTTTPTALLNVQGGGVTTGISDIGTTLTARFNTANPAIVLGIGYVSSDNPFMQAFNSGTNSTRSLIINPFGGNVLIGKTTQVNATYELDVNGSARANEVVVNTTGADFVFESNYNLPTISFLKNYIHKYHHLPEIPSAKQMQTEGLSVGENQVKLLQKVEELTLYLIEKDKQMDNLQNELTQLKQSQQKEIDKLKKQVSALIKSKP